MTMPLVKELEWSPESGLGFYHAETPFGRYSIRPDLNRRDKVFMWYFANGGVEHGPVPADEAKAAAQADYEQRIKSALSLDPEAGEPDEIERVEAEVKELLSEPPAVVEMTGFGRNAVTREIVSVTLWDNERKVSQTLPAPYAEAGEPVAAGIQPVMVDLGEEGALVQLRVLLDEFTHVVFDGYASSKRRDEYAAKILAALQPAPTEPLVKALRALTDAAQGLSHGTDWNNGTHAKLHGYRQKLLDALPDARAALSLSDGSGK